LLKCIKKGGAALGVANTAAYLSTFIGAMIAGIMIGEASRSTIGITIATIAFIWFIWMLIRFENPTKHEFLFIPLADVDMDKLKNLEHEHIAEWYINDTEKVVAIKYASAHMSEDEIKPQILK